MLYVGVLKDKFDAALRGRRPLLFLLVIGLTMLIALFLSVYLIDVYTKPVQRIIAATQDITGGNYHRIDVRPRDDADSRKIGAAFNAMAAAIEERDRKLQDHGRADHPQVREAGLARPSGLGDRPRDQQSPDRRPDLFSCLLLERPCRGRSSPRTSRSSGTKRSAAGKSSGAFWISPGRTSPKKHRPTSTPSSTARWPSWRRTSISRISKSSGRYDPALPAVPVDVQPVQAGHQQPGRQRGRRDAERRAADAHDRL